MCSYSKRNRLHLNQMFPVLLFGLPHCIIAYAVLFSDTEKLYTKNPGYQSDLIDQIICRLANNFSSNISTTTP